MQLSVPDEFSGWFGACNFVICSSFWDLIDGISFRWGLRLISWLNPPCRFCYNCSERSVFYTFLFSFLLPVGDVKPALPTWNTSSFPYEKPCANWHKCETYVLKKKKYIVWNKVLKSHSLTSNKYSQSVKSRSYFQFCYSDNYIMDSFCFFYFFLSWTLWRSWKRMVSTILWRKTNTYYQTST